MSLFLLVESRSNIQGMDKIIERVDIIRIKSYVLAALKEH